MLSEKIATLLFATRRTLKWLAQHKSLHRSAFVHLAAFQRFEVILKRPGKCDDQSDNLYRYFVDDFNQWRSRLATFLFFQRVRRYTLQF